MNDVESISAGLSRFQFQHLRYIDDCGGVLNLGSNGSDWLLRINELKSKDLVIYSRFYGRPVAGTIGVLGEWILTDLGRDVRKHHDSVHLKVSVLPIEADPQGLVGTRAPLAETAPTAEGTAPAGTQVSSKRSEAEDLGDPDQHAASVARVALIAFANGIAEELRVRADAFRNEVEFQAKDPAMKERLLDVAAMLESMAEDYPKAAVGKHEFLKKAP